MANITDIAEKVGVSITTVSRVLNYDKTLSISDEKRKLVLEVAEELNYETPRNRKLKEKAKQKTKTRIGLIHFMSLVGEIEDPYYLSIRLGIEKRCEIENYQMIKVFRHEGVYDVHSLKNLEGIIAIGKFSAADIELFESCSANIVFVDASPFEEKFDSVTFDLELAVSKVLTHLLDKGYTKIGYIGGQEINTDYNTPAGEKRDLAFKTFMSSRNMYFEKYCFMGDLTPRSGYDLMKQALEKDDLPQAFFVTNDSMAIGAIRAIHEVGLHIPKDLAIIGFNDIPTANYTFPPLTTLHIHTEFMGSVAVELLKERLEGREIAKKIITPTKIIVRGSC